MRAYKVTTNVLGESCNQLQAVKRQQGEIKGEQSTAFRSLLPSVFKKKRNVGVDTVSFSKSTAQSSRKL